mmetsp:Transcript_74979/g.168200  ORF Transcript_74979/g.168200 Transcript_74979/m.168200 type:complete len:243 (+) Transcript_74979:928-1656(+)
MPELVWCQSEADEEETRTSDVGVLSTLHKLPELLAVDAHGEKPVDATEERRRHRLTVLDVWLDGVRKVDNLICKLLQVFMRHDGLEVSGLHNVALEEGRQAEVLGVCKLQGSLHVIVASAITSALSSHIADELLAQGGLVVSDILFALVHKLLVALAFLATGLRLLVEVASKTLLLLLRLSVSPRLVLLHLLGRRGRLGVSLKLQQAPSSGRSCCGARATRSVPGDATAKGATRRRCGAPLR